MKPHLRQRAFQEVANTDLLTEIIETSEKHLGFFTDRYPRVFEYTWLIEVLRGTKGNILDVGAGASPLPIILAETAKVTTVDSIPYKDNEWGFIDYSEYSKNCESKAVDIVDFKTRKRYMVAYSISTLEHLTREKRVQAIEKVAKYLKKDGQFLITVDLQKGTNLLWNKSYGKVIEDDHGTVDDFLKELGEFFPTVDHHIQYNIRGVGTDLMYCVAKK